MEKKKYSKPVVVAERFEPQEYCETCWYLDRDDAFATLYHDTDRSKFDIFGLVIYDNEGRYNNGEQVSSSRPPTDFPSSGSFKASQKPEPINVNDNYYWRRRRNDNSYQSHVTGPIYEYTTENGTTYYFEEVQRRGNHS